MTPEEFDEEFAKLKARVEKLEKALEFEGGDPNYLVEHRKRKRAEQSVHKRPED